MKLRPRETVIGTLADRGTLDPHSNPDKISLPWGQVDVLGR